MASLTSNRAVSRATKAGQPARLLADWPAQAWRRRGQPHFQLQLALVAVFFGALVCFAKVVEDYLDHDAITRWDVSFSRWLHAHSTGALVSLFKVLTYAGNVGLLAILTLAVALFLLRRRAVNKAALLCLSALGIEVLNAILKLAFHRPRPQLAFIHLDTYSFPSGHAAGSTAIYAVLLYLIARHRRTPWRIGCAVAWIAIVVLVGFSRLYLDVHYLSDVLAGISLGTAWAAACLSVLEFRPDSAPVRTVPSTCTGDA